MRLARAYVFEAVILGIIYHHFHPISFQEIAKNHLYGCRIITETETEMGDRDGGTRGKKWRYKGNQMDYCSC